MDPHRRPRRGSLAVEYAMLTAGFLAVALAGGVTLIREMVGMGMI